MANDVSTTPAHPVNLVMAIGDSGELEPTPDTDVVEVYAVPRGPSNIAIPATIRWEARARDGAMTPRRLISVEMPSDDRPFVYVRFECDPFVRYKTEDGPVLGTTWGCYVRHQADAADPIFDNLTPHDQARIRLALVPTEVGW